MSEVKRKELPGRLHWWDWRPNSQVIEKSTLRLMAIHAHPDDEASKGAGTVSHYVSQGVRCTLVTCTGGEEGDVLNPAMDRPEVAEALEHIRMEELDEAVEVCGFAAAYLLGYRDSGMPDSEANSNPAAFANCDSTEAAIRMAGVIRAERPQVILTYHQERDYPHPDHIMTHKIAVEAVELAGKSAYPELGNPWEVLKLYWFAWSHARLRTIHEEFVKRGWESPFGEWLKYRDDRDHEITTAIDVGDSLGARRAALLAHRTQIDPDSFWLRLPDRVVKEVHPWEEYVLDRNLTRAELPADQREDDLFFGI